MKNKYIIDNKSVVDIVWGSGKRGGCIRYFLLEDGNKIKANGTYVLILCTKCNTYHRCRFLSRHEEKPYICKSCNVSGENNPFYGKKHPDEFKQKLSNERKGKWGVGENNAMFGKPCFYKMSDEEKQRWKENISKSTQGENNPMFGKSIKDFMTKEKYQLWLQHVKEIHSKFSDEQKKQFSEKMKLVQKRIQESDPIAYAEMKSRAGRSSVSKSQRYKKTKPEIKLEEFLKQNNIEYDYSCIMGSKERCFQYDFIIRHRRILIEVQGNYWHGHPDMYNEDGTDGKKKLNYTQRKNIERDKLKEQFAIEKNFKLIYIWESEINSGDFSKIKDIL